MRAVYPCQVLHFSICIDSIEFGFNLNNFKDPRFDFLCERYKPASKVPAFLNVVDIAGLVQGAHEGKGLGNAFLSHIKACGKNFRFKYNENRLIFH